MTYNPQIPDPNLDMAESITPISTNFTVLNDIFDVNHYKYNDATVALRGKHKFVSFVERTSDEATAILPAADEIAIYSKDDGGNSELYGKTSSRAEFRITKEGNLFTGLLPVVAVNFNNAGAVQGNVLPAAGVTVTPGGVGEFTIAFPNLPDNNYFWSISGFGSTAGIPVIGQVQQDNDYGDVVKVGSIIVNFRNANDATAIAITRACVICWRFQ
jgi:hypothetical protein